MHLAELEKKLLSVARKDQPSMAVPYVFEKRIMAKIRSLPSDPAAFLARTFWRAAMASILVTLLSAAWSSHEVSSGDSMAQEFEVTVFESMDQDIEDSW